MKRFKFTIVALIISAVILLYSYLTKDNNQKGSKPIVISKTEISTNAAPIPGIELKNAENIAAVETIEPLEPKDISEVEENIPDLSKNISLKDILNSLKSDKEEEVLNALELLAHRGDESATVQQALASLLESTKSTEVKSEIFNLIFMFDSKRRMIDAINKMLNDEDEDIRDSAMDNLVEIETKKMIDYLIEALDNKYSDVRENALMNLEMITDQKFEKPEEWKNWWAANRAKFKFE